MAIAMFAVRMMEMTLYQIVDMVAVGDGFVSAAVTVDVRLFVAATGVVRGTVRRVRPTDSEGVLVDVAIVHMVEMAVVQVVGMAVMLNGSVTA